VESNFKTHRLTLTSVQEPQELDQIKDQKTTATGDAEGVE